MTPLHQDDALSYLIDRLSKTAGPAPGRGQARHRETLGSDIWIYEVATGYWGQKGKKLEELDYDAQEQLAIAFYDAAWLLCRRGVLRPGAAFPSGQSGANQLGQRGSASPYYGDGFSLTAWGREWVKRAARERPALPADPSRLSEVLTQFRRLFGAGYAQRAAEAVLDWSTGNYLSACTMAGAAAESILLAVAIAKSKDERKVLAEYQSARGRSRVIARVVGNVPTGIGQGFKDALGILSYWRDDASHGVASTVGEIESHEAISRLLRLAQFTSDHWSVLGA
jgi:hypothetical protein